jgi:hypothetical protein
MEHGMAHIIKRFTLTPSEAAEKASIVDRIRANPIGPWVNGKKLTTPKAKATTLGVKKKS